MPIRLSPSIHNAALALAALTTLPRHPLTPEIVAGEWWIHDAAIIQRTSLVLVANAETIQSAKKRLSLALFFPFRTVVRLDIGANIDIVFINEETIKIDANTAVVRGWRLEIRAPDAPPELGVDYRTYTDNPERMRTIAAQMRWLFGLEDH